MGMEKIWIDRDDWNGPEIIFLGFGDAEKQELAYA